MVSATDPAATSLFHLLDFGEFGFQCGDVGIHVGEDGCLVPGGEKLTTLNYSAIN